ncbi:MAG: heavy-metal-associated domain-containing protein [Deltaproteobacteria bacterium]|nr:heavy-metal-associated domain-containing protein [Deltaproteobacteria bacterium]
MKRATTEVVTGGKLKKAPSATTRKGGDGTGRSGSSCPFPELTCPACVQAVEGALRAVPGVRAATVNLATGRAFVSYEPRETGLPSLHEAVKKTGYRVGGAARGAAREGGVPRLQRRRWGTHDSGGRRDAGKGLGGPTARAGGCRHGRDDAARHGRGGGSR